jgi:outer membrane protein
MLVLLAASLPAAAVTLQEAVQTALEMRGDVESSRMGLESARWQSTGADLWFLPSLSGKLVIQRSHDVQSMEIPGFGSIPTGSEYSSLAGLTLSVPLFIPQGPAGSRLASRAEELAGYQATASEMDAVVQVVQAFYGVLLSEEMLLVSDEALEIASQGYDLASIKYDAGTISRFELLQSRVALENRRPDAIAAENGLQNAMLALEVAMGLDGGSAMQLEGSLDCAPAIPMPGSLEEARAMMLEHSPDLGTADCISLLGDAGVDMARAEFFPMLVFQSDYDFQAAREDWHFETDDYERSWSSSIALQVPIFSGFTDIAGYNSARADRLSAHASARSIRQVSELQLTQAWNGYQAALEGVKSTTATVELAEEGASIAGVSYEAGTITRLDMDQALLALTSTRTHNASALYELRTSEVRLLRAVGMLEGYIR